MAKHGTDGLLCPKSVIRNSAPPANEHLILTTIFVVHAISTPISLITSGVHTPIIKRWRMDIPSATKSA